jgi:hypothetical protein
MVDERSRSPVDSQEVFRVQNFFSIEIEVVHRRREWEQAVAAAAHHAQVRPQNRRTRWLPLAPRALAFLHSLARPLVPVTCWTNDGERRVRTLQAGRASAS